MEQLNYVAFGIALAGGVHDLFTKKIPNWITVPALVCGLLAQCWYFGWGGLWNGFAGAGIAFLLFFPLWAIGGNFGAGDVKLQMAIGAWMGWWLCLYVAAGAIFLGGVFAFFEVLLRGRLPAVAKSTYSFLRALLVPGLVVEQLKYDKQRKFAFGLCIAGAVLGVTLLDHLGRLP
jgi:Flp pilus assembly protein protease CpaA